MHEDLDLAFRRFLGASLEALSRTVDGIALEEPTYTVDEGVMTVRMPVRGGRALDPGEEAAIIDSVLDLAQETFGSDEIDEVILEIVRS